MNGIPTSQPINSPRHTNTRANIHANRLIKHPVKRYTGPKKTGTTSSPELSAAYHTPIKIVLIMWLMSPFFLHLSNELGGVAFLTKLALFFLLFPFVITTLAIAKMVLGMIFGR